MIELRCKICNNIIKLRKRVTKQDYLHPINFLCVECLENKKSINEILKYYKYSKMCKKCNQYYGTDSLIHDNGKCRRCINKDKNAI